ncbi:MAG: hypothetical protein JO354_06965 [Verrucomicrobia bacterium]|nr:hypothetical protein [Verrucomicrobiota bacterium]
MIKVRHLTGHEYEVVVLERTKTTHHVTLDEPARHLAESVLPEKFIEESFRFLLERESNTSILPKFNLSMIANYFPEYPAEVRKKLQVN